MKPVLVIYNPISGAKRTGDVKKTVESVLAEGGYKYVWFETERRKKQKFDKAFDRKFDRVAVIGGDGTVSEVIGYMVEKGIKVPVILIPQGSANLLSRALSIPQIGVKRQLKFGLEKKGQVIDVMKINDKQYGLIAAGVGYDVVIMLQTSRGLKRVLGLFAYVWTFLRTALFHHSREYRVTVDGKTIQVTAKVVMVFNALPLGDLKITSLLLKQKVVPNDGILNVAIINHAMVEVFSGKSVVIESKHSEHYEVDGDVFKGKRLQVEVVPKAVKIVCSKDFK